MTDMHARTSYHRPMLIAFDIASNDSKVKRAIAEAVLTYKYPNEVSSEVKLLV